jgi:hypothetical protein
LIYFDANNKSQSGKYISRQTDRVATSVSTTIANNDVLSIVLRREPFPVPQNESGRFSRNASRSNRQVQKRDTTGVYHDGRRR